MSERPLKNGGLDENWVEGRNRVAGEIARLERELLKIQAALLSARRREMAAKIHSLEEMRMELSTLKSTMESLAARADFPAHRLEELNQLLGARDSTAKHLSEIRVEKDAALAQLSRAESQRQELAAYAPFAMGTDAEKITEWFVSYLGISLQKDGLQKSLSRLKAEADVLEKRLNELSPAFLDREVDWERAAREAAEDEQIASQNSSAVVEKFAMEKSNLDIATRTTSRRRILGGLLFGLAVVPVLGYLAGFHGFLWIGIGSVVGFAASGAVLFIAAARSARVIDGEKEMLRSLELELKQIREEGHNKRRSLNEAMRNSGFIVLDEFLAAAKESGQDRHKLSDLRARAAEAELQRERLQAQSEEIYRHLKEGLSKAGLSCSPGNLKFQIDILRSNLRRFRELDANYTVCMQYADSLKSKDAELEKEHNLKCSLIRSLLQEAQVESPEQFCEECSKRQTLMELMEKEASRTREFSNWRGT